MKRFQGLINRTKSLSTHGPRSQSNTQNFENAPADSPEANAGRAVRLFCESGSASNGGEEVLHLPVIVESAESSPSAAASAAYQIRKFLGKEYQNKPHVQYNAIMLVRILSDNPGPTFTRNFDKSFVAAVKDTLRSCKDASTQQILRETLDALEADKQYDQGLQGLLVMWRKEKGQNASLGHRSSVRMSQQPRDFSAFQQPGQEQQFGRGGGSGRRSGRTTLPTPAELASRVEEARNTAKILLQLVQSTRTEDVLNHELIREFSERCQGAQRSMQSYINCDDPAPDHDTMQTLIETNEQLSLALTRHQRAVLAARRAMGAAESPSQQAATENGYGAFAPPPATGAQNGNGNRSSYEGYQAPAGPPPGTINSFDQRPAQPHHQQSWAKPNNPFADPVEHTSNPAPLAIEPTNYGTGAGAFSHQPQHLPQQPPQIPPLPQSTTTQTFSIEPEPTFAPSPPRRQNTADLENAYSDSEGRVSPILHRTNPAAAPPSREGLVVSPESPHRPGPGPWHHSDITQSYVGRQSSAANGITMHGGQSDDNVQEIDGYSQVGRRDHGAGPGSMRSSEYDVSPVEVRTAQVGRRY
ncbi:hypothetical protein M409DRAFT_69381 [Zasmidium cellare ATCC 36951]|uniref:GAT domain-containing protein n=1 Tax=Zasmidium cellare ATCC 36951 TaxID=1080233 RepID=A0A6A6C9P6_ZASCE|nr:uncharacterized protein M409DRAFT_69381 [Zasmidium cellare ATCC 36951]KAF2162176.1 hypothetical protein M409DRAFT_69381 [Zasmidium cellare ATCC 36951]